VKAMASISVFQTDMLLRQKPGELLGAGSTVDSVVTKSRLLLHASIASLPAPSGRGAQHSGGVSSSQHVRAGVFSQVAGQKLRPLQRGGYYQSSWYCNPP
jgi:hypothetical protein